MALKRTVVLLAILVSLMANGPLPPPAQRVCAYSAWTNQRVCFCRYVMGDNFHDRPRYTEWRLCP